jgi:hypothetical protein
MMDYACFIWRFATRTLVRKMQVLQFKCFRIAINAPLYTGNRQIHDDSEVLFFSNHIRSLTERRLEVTWCKESLSSGGRQIPMLIEGWPRQTKWTWADRDRQTCQDFLSQGGHVDNNNRTLLALFDYPDWVFPRDFFLSRKTNARVQWKRRGTTYTLHSHSGFTSVP